MYAILCVLIIHSILHLCVVHRLLVFFDQHAVHERVRVEALIKGAQIYVYGINGPFML